MYQIVILYKQIQSITDLIKSLLECSRQKFKKTIKEYSENIQKTPEKGKPREIKSQNLLKRVLMNRPQQKCYDTDLQSKSTTQKVEKITTLIQKVPIRPLYFSLIEQVIEDLDEQNILVLEYQCQKRLSLTPEEFKMAISSNLEKLKFRNFPIQQTISSYLNVSEPPKQTLQSIIQSCSSSPIKLRQFTIKKSSRNINRQQGNTEISRSIIEIQSPPPANSPQQQTQQSTQIPFLQIKQVRLQSQMIYKIKERSIKGNIRSNSANQTLQMRARYCGYDLNSMIDGLKGNFE